MSSIRSLSILLIAGTVGCLGADSSFNAASAQSMMPVDNYGAPAQATTMRSLGTIPSSAVNNGSMNSPGSYANQAQPAATTYGGHEAAGAVDSDDTMHVMQAGDISYITGGVGDEEREQLHQMANAYNLRIMSASKDGAFTGDAHVTIRDKKGDTLLDTDIGPIFLANLKPGTYTVEASHQDQVKRQKIMVGKKPALVHLSW